MPRRSPEITEAAMRAAERRIPELAAKSGHAAYKLALARTGAVLVKTSKGTLVERKADGTSTVIKTLPPGKRVKVGLVLKRAKQDAAA
jgi:protein PhnA